MKKLILSITTATVLFAFNAEAAAGAGIPSSHRSKVKEIVREKMVKRGWTLTYKDIDRITDKAMATGDWSELRKSVQMAIVEEAERRRGGSSAAAASYEESERLRREAEVLERRRAENTAAAEARLSDGAARKIQAGARGMQGRRRAAAARAEVSAAASAEHAARIPGLLEAAETLKDQIHEQAVVKRDLDRANELLAELRGVTDTVEELRTHLTDADYSANAGDLTIIYDLYADAETAIARQS